MQPRRLPSPGRVNTPNAATTTASSHPTGSSTRPISRSSSVVRQYLTRCRRHARARRRLRRRRARRGVPRTPRDRGRRSELQLGARAARVADRRCPSPRRRFDRALCLDVLEHLSFEDQSRALGRAVPRAPARRRAARLGAEPRAPAVARALPARRAADSHGQSAQASRRSPDRRVPRSGARARASRSSIAAASSRPCRC